MSGTNLIHLRIRLHSFSEASLSANENIRHMIRPTVNHDWNGRPISGVSQVLDVVFVSKNRIEGECSFDNRVPGKCLAVENYFLRFRNGNPFPLGITDCTTLMMFFPIFIETLIGKPSLGHFNNVTGGSSWYRVRLVLSTDLHCCPQSSLEIRLQWTEMHEPGDGRY